MCPHTTPNPPPPRHTHTERECLVGRGKKKRLPLVAWRRRGSPAANARSPARHRRFACMQFASSSAQCPEGRLTSAPAALRSCVHHRLLGVAAAVAAPYPVPGGRYCMQECLRNVPTDVHVHCCLVQVHLDNIAAVAQERFACTCLGFFCRPSCFFHART